MKFIIILFLLFFVNIIFANNVLIAQTDTSNIEVIDEEQITIEATDTIPKIPLSEFIYADTRRYSLAGGLPQAETKIKPLTAAIFAGTYTGIFILQHQLQMKTIWKEHSSKFRIIDDGPQDLWIDKMGHLYGAYTAGYFLREALVASGFSWNASNNIGAALGVAYSTYVEIWDGFGEHWGFSPTDWAADLAGGIFFVAQNYVPALQNISPKFMYIPSEWTGYTSRIPHDMFNDDYSSQFFFYSINVYNLLPEKWKEYYPPWLEISVGYTVRNLLENNAPERQDLEPCSECISIEKGFWGSPRFVIALDYNMAKLLPDGCNTWNWFKQSLNLLKFPSPALEIGKVTRFYLMFPFKIF
ncbi:MAG: YfiM family protein [Ignavibacteria bacterium]|jgi:hypothetical protein|nr:YfiM family protein [Ignavibacteria bacterium]